MNDSEIIQWINARTPPESMWDSELQMLLDLTKLVSAKGVVVEIGVYGGRSAAVYLHENARRPPKDKFSIHLIDSWVLNQSDAKPNFFKLAQQINSLYHPHWKPSQEAVGEVPDEIDLLHIDGDHDRGAWDDCRNYLPKVKLDGYVAVHDYGEPETYPEVQKAVNHNLVGSLDWLTLPLVGRLYSARKVS